MFSNFIVCESSCTEMPLLEIFHLLVL
uniref:Uncharacterized protein n=1 Tax=Rhizophora mucronata TaxID=61149 RepID=A0A2P2R248_RHIMU